MSIIGRMNKVLENVSEPAVEEEGTEGPDTSILQHLALAAASMGIDMTDEGAVDQFIGDVKTAITKDKAKLKSALRRFTPAKAKAAAKGSVKAVS